MKVLITGGVGFIGLNLTEYLLEKTDFEIRVMDISTERRKYLRDDVEFVQGDITRKHEVQEAIKDCDCVVNLAAQTGVIPSIENPFRDAEVNVMGTLNLLNESKGKIKKFVHASSSAPLGEQKPPLHEEKVPRPLAPYGASKLAAEGYCCAFQASYDLTTICLRFSNVYGSYALHKNSVVHKFIKRSLQDKPLTVYGDGKQTRDLIHAEDICQAILKSLEGDVGGIFQIGTGKETTIGELARLIENISGKELEIKFEEERKGEIRKNYSLIDKARKELGFKPQVKLREGLERTYFWFQRNLDN